MILYSMGRIEPHLPRSAPGFTLIEVTLVVAVLLGLISVLFIGVAAYKKGTNRNQCITTVATVQRAVRSYQNIYEYQIGDPFDHTTMIVGTGLTFEREPMCPEYGSYSWLDVFPTIGTTVLDCQEPAAFTDEHAPVGTVSW